MSSYFGFFGVLNMKFKTYLFIWFVITVFGVFEYWALNFHPHLSSLLFLQGKGHIPPDFKISPDPGRPLSLWLGWLGFGLMVTMNVYSMRKRFGFMKSWGRLPKWLDFHVFCGLLGPSFIILHCNLKIRGLVGISFWSMVISFSSGIIGRYFYLQLTGRRAEFEALADKYKQRLVKLLTVGKIEASDKEVGPVLAGALVQMGLPKHGEDVGVFSVFYRSFVCDITMAFKKIKIRQNWPQSSRTLVKEYALNMRRAASLEPFQRLMGYWHAFHFPFAIFMYVAAVIHIIAALLFGTGK
jgi:hypothetical protein